MKKTAIYLLSFLTAAFMLFAVCFTAFGGVNAVRADDEEEEQKKGLFAKLFGIGRKKK